jgi:AraC-like DNA-binding protein/quercetin dioxygenase-like cupin family protein
MRRPNMAYVKTTLKEEFVIESIVSVHYFEFAKNYVFEGESHDFWEFVYVDRGELEIMADDKGYKLRQGEMIFHKPNEFHNLWANGNIAPNIIVVSFVCNSMAMKYFENKILSTGDHVKNLLASIIKESMEAFSTPLSISTTVELVKREKSIFGCEQLIKIFLTQLLIYLIRKGTDILTDDRLSSSVRERSNNDISLKIKEYLGNNLFEDITLEDVSQYVKLSRTSLQIIFKEQSGTGVMEYYRMLKIKESKNLIREGQLNLTQIADQLHYSSIHYFSRHFKKVTGMTPSEYASSVKAKL